MRVFLLPLLLMVVTLIRADRSHDNRNLSREARLRRHDAEDRSSGRRWTTSRNSPYQKIVSSFEQAGDDLREAGSQRMETATAEEQDQAKAKSHKRKQWRTRAPTHDLIPSETSSDTRHNIGKDDEEHESSESLDGQEQEVSSEKPSSSAPRRRQNTSKDSVDIGEFDSFTPNPKKRRRLTTSTATTTTFAPQTMSDSLYQHFRPLDQDVPQDDIIPFLDFGRKLSPVLPTPSGANSIENKSTVTRSRPRGHQDEKDPADEDMLQEDMDVSVVKKAIERNSVPRAKLTVREQGISDYYRKRAPQVRTTENLISTSDSSTASSIGGPKGILVLKKTNRHQIHHSQTPKAHDHPPKPLSSGVENLHLYKNVELLEDKYEGVAKTGTKRFEALTEETNQSPLTAESTLVKTVIKELPVLNPTFEKNLKTIATSELPRLSESSTESKETSTLTNSRKSSIQEPNENVNSPQKESSKIISTAVVTSISIQEPIQGTNNLTTKPPQSESPQRTNESSLILNSTEKTTTSKTVSTTPGDQGSVTKLVNAVKNFTNIPVSNSSAFHGSPGEPSTTTPSYVKNATSLRSRDIYRPKAIPPGAKIPHLPRQIPFISNTSRSSAGLSASPTMSNKSLTNDTLTSPEITRSTISDITTVFSPSTSSPSTTISSTTHITKTTPKVKLVPITIPEDIPYIEISKEVKHSNKGEDAKTEEVPTEFQPASSPSEEPHTVQNSHSILVQPTPIHDEETDIPTSNPYLEEPTDSESVPPPKYDETPENLTFVPVETSEEDSEDQFPIYFTTVSTVTKPVVDTRPETEASVVHHNKNLSHVRPGADWAKIGVVDKEVEVVLPETLGAGAYILAGLGVVPILIGALIGAKFLVAHNKKKVLDESEYSSEYNRSPLGNATASPLPTKLPRIPTHVSWNETEKSPPPLPPPLPPPPTITPVSASSSSARWEFPREKLRLQTLLGQGNFGQVWKAEADDIAGHEGLTRLVAVKSVKESANTREREDLLRELGILQELGSHPNVVTLLGCCTEKEPIYLIMEYVMYGKLLSFLRDYRTRAHYYNFSDAGDALTSRDLTVFGYCVARGMDYLTNKSIIHRDMAARNVLVDHNKLCKIADFGMSRNVRDTGQIYEQRQSKGALPIRWMAPESLAFSLFTHKTDVWSFGILMWEIVTLGSTPYATMGAREVMRRVQDGYRLERPSHCQPELFRLIAQCWHSEPSKRPTFAELKAELGMLLNDSAHNGSLVDLEGLAEEMRRDTLHRHH